MANVPFTMKHKTSSGYDTLYPKTIGSQVDGAVANATNSTKLNGHTYNQVIANAKTASHLVQYGTYVGTGTAGESNKNTLTFNFQPMVVFISGYGSSISQFIGTTMIYGSSNCPAFFGFNSNVEYQLYLTWSGNSVSWYSPRTSANQGNNQGSTYYWVAIG